MSGRDRHYGELPWGWWLRASGSVLEDDEGRRWHTVRDAFWHGELGFPSSNVGSEQHELLLRVLTGIHAGWSSPSEDRQDLFLGNTPAWRFYMCWLASVGLTYALGHRGALDAPLSTKGRSVMMMLQATRDPAWEALPMSEVIEAIARAERGPEGAAREEALKAFEGGVGLRRYVFARERLGRAFLITLTGIAADARMPTRRVIWSQPFTDANVRDDLFAWLAARVHRWDDWGRIAYRTGGEELTRHILALVMSGRNLS